MGTIQVARRLSPWLFWGLLLTLVLTLRLLGADTRGIWQDEGLTLYQVRLPVAEILANRIPVAQFNTQNTVPPFYFLLLGGWGRLVGYGLWSLRLFSIFCSLLIGLLLYAVGRWMAGPRVGRMAALLAALSPLYLWYAQELRMYTFLLIPATLSMGLLWRWQQETRPALQWRWALAYGLTAAAMAWTHYLAFLLIGAQMVWLVLVLLRRAPRFFLIALGFFFLLALPLIPFGIRRLLAGQERDFFFQPLESIVGNLMHSLAFGPPFFVSRLEEIAWLLPLAWALLGLGLWQAWRRGRWPLALLLGTTLILPVLLIYALSFVKPLYQNARHLIVVSPAFYLLWALGLQRLAELRRWLPLLVLPLLAYGWGLSFQHYYSNDGDVVQKNDLRPLFEYMAEHYVPGDVVALNDPVLQHTLEYFAPGVPWTILPGYAEPITAERTIPLYEQVAQQYERVWYVYGPPDSSFDTWRHVYDWFHG
ncbi:MAG: glycosyltransferase family 39 protein, partial [Ardenticatenales bacterium]|nr:glycosyltransferase family 39 protein [Ardenticatenales bacterium]